MKSAASKTRLTMVGIIAMVALAGCVSRTYYPADITNVKPYPRPARRPAEPKSAPLAAKTAPIALRAQTPPSAATPLPQAAPAVAEQRDRVPHPSPELISTAAQTVAPASRSNTAPAAIPDSVTAPSGSLSEQIRIIQELRRKGVLTQDESDKFVLRVVEQAK